jgi:hypothetical protein
MFLHYYVEMDKPAKQVEADLLDSPSTWMPALASGALARGEAMLAQVRARPAEAAGPTGLARSDCPEIQLGEPVRFPSKLSLPMSWDAGGRVLLPRLDADLELGSLGSMRSQLAINGRYQLPPSTDGRITDRLAFHRIAEATIKDFLDRVAIAIGSGKGGRARAPQR